MQEPPPVGSKGRPPQVNPALNRSLATACRSTPGWRPHLMPVERVEQPALHEVQDLQGGVTGGRDEVVSRRVEGEGIHRCTVH